jgi:sec-independent protein translocase protein TatA
MFDSPWHWAVVAIVAFVLFFGWKQLPDMARSLGRSLRIFKTEIKGMSEDDKTRAKAHEEAEGEQKSLPQAEVIRREQLPERPASEPPQSRPRPSPRP